jgi:uncharacterized protein YgiM (DUF1202 family)
LIVFLARLDGMAKTMYVTETSWVKINGGPSTQYKVIARVRSGDPVTIIGQEGTWFHIRTAQDEDGWIMAPLLTEQKPLTAEVDTLSSKTTEQGRLITQLTEENKSLRKYAQQFESSSAEIKHLRDENVRLKGHQNLLWVGVGAGILFIGWLIGMITGSFYRRGRSKYRYSFD